MTLEEYKEAIRKTLERYRLQRRLARFIAANRGIKEGSAKAKV